MAINLRSLVAIFSIVLCPWSLSANEPNSVPIALASRDYITEVQNSLGNSGICSARNASEVEIIISRVDSAVGTSSWGWSCSRELTKVPAERKAVLDWASRSRQEILDAFISLDRSDFGSAISAWSTDEVGKVWPENSYPYYEYIIDVISGYEFIRSRYGVGYTSWGGRYMEFYSLSNDKRINASYVQMACQKNSFSLCIPSFFVFDKDIYPLISRKYEF